MRGTESRRSQILQLIQENGEVRVDSLASRFGVSEVSIRKDLAELETQGTIIRRFGGAVLAVDTSASAVVTPELEPNKDAIAKCAAQMVGTGQRLIIDSGRTTAAIVPYLQGLQDLVIMTNSLPVVTAITGMETDATVLMTGGTWDRRSESFQGHLAEKMLMQYDFDWLFVGADGIDLERGTTTFNELTGVSQKMALSAKQVVLVAESSKIDRKIYNLELTWENINFFFTDAGLNSQHRQIIESKGVKIITTPV